MDTAQLLRTYDEQLRREAELDSAQSYDADGPLLRAVMSRGGFVTYRDLGGLVGDELDALIARTVAHFRDATTVDSFEWKSRGHDAPADLGERLEAHGLVAEEVETVMIGEAERLAVDVELPAGVVVRRAGDGADLRADLTRMLALQEQVFGHPGPTLDDAVAGVVDGSSEQWLAEADGVVLTTGRLTPVPGTEVAGLWGGGTHPDWRGRGLYRALVAARARSAMARGVRYLHSDCTAMSRPILERSGLVAVTTTTPYLWTRAG